MSILILRIMFSGTQLQAERQGGNDRALFVIGYSYGVGDGGKAMLIVTVTPTGLSDSDACIHQRRAQTATS